MVETLIIIQSAILLLMLVVLVVILLNVKKAVEAAKSELELINRKIDPVLDTTKTILENINRITVTAGKGAENVTLTTELVKDTASMLHNAAVAVKGSVDRVSGLLSLYKLGLAKGFEALVAYYMNKKNKEV